jgi:hypothetical protein
MKMVLRLNLIYKWFALIDGDVKKEEYRAITPYWLKRLFYLPKGLNDSELQEICNDLKNECSFNFHDLKVKEFDSVNFKNGWKRKDGTAAPEMNWKFEGIYLSKGKKEWGGTDDFVFVISLGERIVR